MKMIIFPRWFVAFGTVLLVMVHGGLWGCSAFGGASTTTKNGKRPFYQISSCTAFHETRSFAPPLTAFYNDFEETSKNEDDDEEDEDDDDDYLEEDDYNDKAVQDFRSKMSSLFGTDDNKDDTTRPSAASSNAKREGSPLPNDSLSKHPRSNDDDETSHFAYVSHFQQILSRLTEEEKKTVSNDIAEEIVKDIDSQRENNNLEEEDEKKTLKELWEGIRKWINSGKEEDLNSFLDLTLKPIIIICPVTASFNISSPPAQMMEDSVGETESKDDTLLQSEFLRRLIDGLKKRENSEAIKNWDIVVKCLSGENEKDLFGLEWNDDDARREKLDSIITQSTRAVKIQEIQTKFTDVASGKENIITTKRLGASELNEILGEYTLKRLKAEIPSPKPLKDIEEEEDQRIVKPSTLYVDTEEATSNDPFGTRVDEEFAIVVAGECGSGKSVFSCQKARENGFLVLYKCLNTESFRIGKNRVLEAPIEYPQVCGLLRKLIVCCGEIKSGESDVAAGLAWMKSTLNESRNQWAFDAFRNAYSAIISDKEPYVQKWLDGKFPQNERPEKVAIVIDEATNIDLVEGLVSCVEEIIERHRHLVRPKGRVQLVLVGTGTDAIHRGRVGTSPSLVEIVTMKQPNLGNVLQNEQELHNAVKAALEVGYCRILRTNARMFFRGVLPILRAKEHEVDANGVTTKETRYTERLKAITSYQHIMDYPVRYYLRTNTVGKLENQDRELLLRCAFVYHQEEALNKAINQSNDKTRNELVSQLGSHLMNVKNALYNNVIQEKGEPSEGSGVAKGSDSEGSNDKNVAMELFFEEKYDTLFEKGLARRNGTSNALKYLSCSGSTKLLLPSMGKQFEEVVSLHCMRLFEVQGYATETHELENGWPRSRRKNEEMREEDLKEELSELALKEPFFSQNEVKNNTCFVVSQGVPNAQGPDLFVVLVDKEWNVTILAIQCKHYARLHSNLNDWCQSLGIGNTESSNKETKQKKEISKQWCAVAVQSFQTEVDSPA